MLLEMTNNEQEPIRRRGDSKADRGVCQVEVGESDCRWRGADIADGSMSILSWTH